jgi:phosphoribosylaminoimidazole-succinocarboxamide synthase
MISAVLESNLDGLKLINRGKVRDMYDMGDSLLMVSSDRISAFDVVMPVGIPDKGKILNLISLYWFDMMKNIVSNHVINGNVAQFPAQCQRHAALLNQRSMLVRKAKPIPIECVVRGYLSGSGWQSYKENGKVCGIELPKGLRESDRLPEPLFTPSTKEEVGVHDINIDFTETCRRIGTPLAEKIRDLSLTIYRHGAQLALERGIIIADTKFEFGLLDDQVILIDEVLTPDSSRFWPLQSYKPGGSQPSFDKQYLRDYLVSIKWNKKPPAPPLPDDVVNDTRTKYLEALRLITGSTHGL